MIQNNNVYKDYETYFQAGDTFTCSIEQAEDIQSRRPDITWTELTCLVGSSVEEAANDSFKAAKVTIPKEGVTEEKFSHRLVAIAPKVVVGHKFIVTSGKKTGKNVIKGTRANVAKALKLPIKQARLIIYDHALDQMYFGVMFWVGLEGEDE